MEIRRFVFTYWATCFLTTGLDAPIAEKARLENLRLNENFQTDSGQDITSVQVHDIEHCHQYCNKQEELLSYCDVRCPVPGKCCKTFQTKCLQTSLNNQTEFDRFADTKIKCAHNVFMISPCSTNYSSTTQHDINKKRDFKHVITEMKQKNSFFDQVINIAPVTDLYTGFTYVNFEVYKRYAENKSEPIFWIAELQTNLVLDPSIYDAFNNYLNTSYFHSMNVSFKSPTFLKESDIGKCIGPKENPSKFVKFKFSILLSLTNAEIMFDDSESLYPNPNGWTRVQCDLLKTSNQEEFYPCQVQGCDSDARLLDGQCKKSQMLLLAFQLHHFLDYDHAKLLNYAKCYLYEHSNLQVNESSHLPAIKYLMWRQEKHIIFTLTVFVNHSNNNEVEYSEHILNMTWSMFFLIKHSKATNQNMNSLSENESIGSDTHRVCFAFLKAEFNWNITRVLDNSLVCSDVHVNVSLILDDKEYQLRFSCRQHLDWSERSFLNTASLLSKYVIAIIFCIINTGFNLNISLQH
ncbi:hypothetical protein BgiMline_012323 [Biomphalaria glabrata]|nr:hypothetical protein BgiMline_032377 [Biomphalaria glabrata]